MILAAELTDAPAVCQHGSPVFQPYAWSWDNACEVDQPTICAASLLFIQIILTGWVETKRLMDFQKPGTQDNWLGEGGQFKPMANGYPGGAFFDPFGLSRGSEAQLRKYQVEALISRPCSMACSDVPLYLVPLPTGAKLRDCAGQAGP